MLSDIDDNIGKASIIQLCSSGQWPPTISEIRETAISVLDGDVAEPSAWESWERVLDCRTVSETEKRVLNLVGGSWEIRNTKNIGVLRSNYIKAYQEITDADRKRRLAIPSVAKLAESNRPPEVTPVDRQIESPHNVDHPIPGEVSALLKSAGFDFKEKK